MIGLVRRWRSERRLDALIREGFGQTEVPIEHEDAAPEPVPPELIARTVEAATALHIAQDILGPTRSPRWKGWPLPQEDAEILARAYIATCERNLP